MKKIISLVIVSVFVLAMTVLPAYAAEDFILEFATSGNGVGEVRPDHGYPDKKAVLLTGSSYESFCWLVGIGEGQSIASLSDYEKVVVTYATDPGFVATRDGKKASIGLKAMASEDYNGENYFHDHDGFVFNQTGSIASAELSNAEETNPNGVNWDKTERTVEISLADVQDPATKRAYLMVFLPAGESILILDVRLIAKVEATTEPTTTEPATTEPATTEPETTETPTENPSTGVLSLTGNAIVFVYATVLMKKKRSKM